MKTWMRKAGVMALGLWCLACAGASAAPQAPTTLEGAFKSFVESYNDLDWDVFQAAFAEDVSIFIPDGPGARTLQRIDGREAVLKSFRGVFEAAHGHGPNVVPEHVRIHRLQNAAIVSFEFQRGAGSFGRRTVIFEHQGRRWLVVHIHASNILAKPAS